MPGQKTMNGTDRESTPLGGMSRNITRFAHDVLELSELQAKLASHDLKDAKPLFSSSLLLLGIALTLGLASLPILMFAFAWLLIDLADWPTHLAYLTVAAVGLGLASGCAYWGWRHTMKTVACFNRSRVELQSNLRWIKKALASVI